MISRARDLAAAALELLERLRWYGRRHVPALVITGVLVLGAGGGWVYRSSHADPVHDEVRAAAALLRTDFAAHVETLGGAYLRTFRGVEDGVIVGDVTRAVSRGACWGFEVRIAAAWLSTGEGQIDVGEVHRYDTARCRR